MSRKLWLTSTHEVGYTVEHICAVDQFTDERTDIVRQMFGGIVVLGVTLGPVIIISSISGITAIWAIIVIVTVATIFITFIRQIAGIAAIFAVDIQWQVITVIICLSIWRSIVFSKETIFIFYIQYLTLSDSYSLLVYLVSPRGMAWMEYGMWVIRSMMMAKQVLSQRRCRRWHRWHHISAKVCRSSPVIMANACLSTVIAMAVMTAETRAMSQSAAPVSHLMFNVSMSS